MKNIIIIDLGTTNVKAIAYNHEGSAVFEISDITPVYYARDIMQINPEKLWKTVSALISAVCSRLRDEEISGISISSMAATIIPLDRDNKPLFDAIGWSDNRSMKYMESFLKRFIQGERIKDCGQYPLQMYTPFKIEWFKENHPEAYSRVFKWVNVSEYIYNKLLGVKEFYTDFSIASRNMLFDDKKKAWNSHALEYFNIDEGLLALPLESSTVIGTVGAEAQSLGLSAKTQVVLGGHDHMCAALSAALTKEKLVLNSTGTSEAVVSLMPSDCRPERQSGRWMNCESSVMHEKIMAVAYVSATGQIYEHGLKTFLPFDEGEFDPTGQPIFIPPQRAQMLSVKGAFLDVGVRFDAQSMTRAMRDGMYYEFRRLCERMLETSSKEPVIRCVGGHTKNMKEIQLKSSVSGYRIETIRESNFSARGAFLLAAKGLGFIDSAEKRAEQLYELMPKTMVYPVERLSKKYDEIYNERYLKYFADGVDSL